MDRKKVTIPALHAKKQRGEPITMITAYDYPGALAVDEAGVDLILVGDSLGMVVLGYDSTVPVTMDEMISHTAAVKRGTKYAHIVGDMPFLSYQADAHEAIHNAGRFLKEGGADSVKLEGGAAMAPIVKAIVDAGIAVMGHIGLTPQSASKLGGYRVQGKTAGAAQKLLEDALALQDAGAYAIVLETTPDRVSEFVSKQTQHSHHRHRRRRGLRRASAGLSRSARLLRSLLAQTQQALRQPQAHHRRRGEAVRG